MCVGLGYDMARWCRKDFELLHLLQGFSSKAGLELDKAWEEVGLPGIPESCVKVVPRQPRSVYVVQ